MRFTMRTTALARSYVMWKIWRQRARHLLARGGAGGWGEGRGRPRRPPRLRGGPSHPPHPSHPSPRALGRAAGRVGVRAGAGRRPGEAHGGLEGPRGTPPGMRADGGGLRRQVQPSRPDTRREGTGSPPAAPAWAQKLPPRLAADVVMTGRGASQHEAPQGARSAVTGRAGRGVSPDLLLDTGDLRVAGGSA